jgi:hypothetical protein
MSERVVVCDFCSLPLSSSAWDFPARDIDYGEPRIGPGMTAPIEGAIGSWLACDGCAELVRRGERDRLAKRSAGRLVRTHPEATTSIGGMRSVLALVREQHDMFWQAREGDGTRLGREQIELIARDPPFVRQRRDG